MSLIDLFIPDRSALTISSENAIVEPLYPFYFNFNSLPHALTKKCLATQSLFTKLAKRLKGSMTLSIMSLNRVGFQAVTWDGERIAIQLIRSDSHSNNFALSNSALDISH